MARGIAIVIGVRASPIFRKYGLDVLAHAEADAGGMAGIAREMGYEVTCLLGADATRAAVEDAAQAAAQALTGPGDTLLLSFSGHGVKTDTRHCESDFTDEHWCLYDGLVVDDRIRSYWRKLGSQAHVFTVADCCYSGEIGEWLQMIASLSRLAGEMETSLAAMLPLPEHIAKLNADIDRERRQVREDDPTLDCTPPQARVLLLASVESGRALDGAFMRGLRRAWVYAGARQSFKVFRDRIELEVLNEIKQPPLLTPFNSELADQPPFKF